jgi:hypothetical protein
MIGQPPRHGVAGRDGHRQEDLGLNTFGMLALCYQHVAIARFESKMESFWSSMQIELRNRRKWNT